MYNNNPIRRKAITIKEISGKCIEPIPTGKVFDVIVRNEERAYSTCENLGVTSVWNDEYKFID